MRLIRHHGGKFTNKIKTGYYPNNVNIGMTALHFAVRDHASIDVIKEIYEGYPLSIFTRDACGCTPIDLCGRVTPNTKVNWSDNEWQQVKNYLETLCGNETESYSDSE